MSKTLLIWLAVFATSVLFAGLGSCDPFYLFWSAIAVAYVCWCIWVFRYSRKITYSDKKLHSALDVISKPAFIVPVLYHRAYAEYLEFVHTCEMAHVAVPTFECWKNEVRVTPDCYVCFYCEQPIVPPTRWLPVPGELQKKLCSKCYE